MEPSPTVTSGDPEAATTAALADVLTTALAKASAVPHATAGDAYRAGIEAIRPLIEARARAAERERIRQRLLAHEAVCAWSADELLSEISDTA